MAKAMAKPQNSKPTKAQVIFSMATVTLLYRNFRRFKKKNIGGDEGSNSVEGQFQDGDEIDQKTEQKPEQKLSKAQVYNLRNQEIYVDSCLVF